MKREDKEESIDTQDSIKGFGLRLNADGSRRSCGTTRNAARDERAFGEVKGRGREGEGATRSPETKPDARWSRRNNADCPL